MESSDNSRNDVSIVICGEAGQGIQTIEGLLVRILQMNGYNVFATKEYMSRVRGGSNSTQIRVSSKRIASFVNRMDIFVPLDKDAVEHLRSRISENTVIIGSKDNVQIDLPVINVPFSAIASEIGGPIYANTVAIGVILGIFDADKDLTQRYLERYFSQKGEKVAGNNVRAAEQGFAIGEAMRREGAVVIPEIDKNASTNEILLDGTEAVSLGALAGGCNFIAAYPMTPGTGVLQFLAHRAAEGADLIAEQAEDEIAAINMALGAWYAGARGMVTTSGGGFALMVEGISLSGMIETPVVVHLGQRPGPATGLPTRTEQGDLNFALHAGHGEFPRMIFAPGTLEEGYSLTRRAFDMADRYQIPVILLTDQFFIDSVYNIPELPVNAPVSELSVTVTSDDYVRYAITPDGISPRGVPGFGDGIVDVDSDEHNESGHITEDFLKRTEMVRKRLKKYEAMQTDILKPNLIGPSTYTVLVVCWGSARHVVTEAVENLQRDDIAVLHFNQVYPLHPDTRNYLIDATRTVVVENNATAQFANLIKVTTGYEVTRRILKYNGLPFAVEEVTLALAAILKESI